MSKRKQRLVRVEAAMRSWPVRGDRLAQAFQEFIESGVLPEEKRLAWAVCEQALNAGQPMPAFADQQSRLVYLIRVAMAAADRGEQPMPKEMSVRERLFDEAVYAPDLLRHFAREVLKIRIGFLEEDPTDANWLVDQPLPDHPGLGLFMLGFPRCFAVPPYEEQADRLFARADDLRRNRIDHDDPTWERTLESALQLLSDRGQVPDEGLLRDAVLVILELQALMWHSRGESVRELMSMLDAAARTTGTEREAAVARVGEIARRGFCDPPDREETKPSDASAGRGTGAEAGAGS